MDAAKIMWVMYEHPETHFEELALRFMDIRKRIYKFPKMGVKAKMIAVTTTSGTGSEVTPFAVVTDDTTGQKYPLADYALTPDMAIVDANLVMDMPKSLCAFGGLDAVTHAMEAYVSVLASEFSDGQALQALKLLKEYLPASYHEGSKNPVARTCSQCSDYRGYRVCERLPGCMSLNGAQTGFPVPYSARSGKRPADL